MRQRPFTYLLYIVLLFCLIWGGSTEGYAQRALKHRKGILTADSIRAQNVADSLALLDTLNIRQQRIEELEAPVDTAMLMRLPVPNNSIWLSLAIPGAGQIYNRKYWKLPIVYGGFVGCTYALTWNSKMYKDYTQAYQDIMSDNPNNDSYMDFLPAGYTKEDVQNRLDYYQELFRKRKDVFRRQRDLSIISFIAVYLLSVIDAYVDAELSNFDISNDLGMTLEPTIFNDAYRKLPQGVGLQCSIRF